MTDESVNHRCGLVAIVGRPNVGKSTFLNHSLGQKLSITSRKPQTTRHQIVGIKTVENSQIVYVDTPGLQLNPDRELNRFMNREVTRIVTDVDVIVFMIEAGKWNDLDENALKLVLSSGVENKILVINKIDKLADRSELLPYISEIQKKADFTEIIPMIARHGENIQAVENTLFELLPESERWYPEDQITDRSERFLAAEMIREKLMRKLGDEVPHRLSVTIDQFKDEGNLIHIHATIWVERAGQKRIVIGKKGSVLKEVGKEARIDIERMLDRKVFLETWVKVREKWSDNVQALNQFGLKPE